jgi:hypothetical protein
LIRLTLFPLLPWPLRSAEVNLAGGFEPPATFFAFFLDFLAEKPLYRLGTMGFAFQRSQPALKSIPLRL